MHITDVMIDDASGGVIIPGQITIRDFQAKLGEVPPHDLIMLDFGSGGLLSRPVIGFERLETGFCKISATGPYLQLSKLSSLDFNTVLLGKPSGAISTKASGSNGSARTAAHNPIYKLTGYDLSEKKVAAGLSFKIAGNIMELHSDQAVPAVYDDGFNIEGVIPWDTLMVKGYDAGGAHKFTPQGTFLTALGRETVRDPLSLGDLMISEGLTWPCIFGSLEVATAKQTARPVETFFVIHIKRDRISFDGVSKLEQLTNGFCRYMNYGINHYLSLNLVGGEFLEEAFRLEDYAEFSCEGALLGKLSRDTGYGDGHGDPLGRIEQSIASYRLAATLEYRGLHLRYEGRLQEFETKTFERHRKERNSSLVPWQTFKADAINPWSLLFVRGFAIARRRKDFDRSS